MTGSGQLSPPIVKEIRTNQPSLSMVNMERSADQRKEAATEEYAKGKTR
jgi:hypothetical protein